MFFNPFKIYSDMLKPYSPNQDEEKEVEWVTCEYEVPEELANELDKVVATFLKKHGIEAEFGNDEEKGSGE